MLDPAPLAALKARHRIDHAYYELNYDSPASEAEKKAERRRLDDLDAKLRQITNPELYAPPPGTEP